GRDRIDGVTGELLARIVTAREPGGVMLVSCGDRRAGHCPSCAETYRYDAFHLLASGLRGGKGIPETVAAHPAVMVTFTAPSFGGVHTIRDRDGSGACGGGGRSGRHACRSEVVPVPRAGGLEPPRTDAVETDGAGRAAASRARARRGTSPAAGRRARPLRQGRGVSAPRGCPLPRGH